MTEEEYQEKKKAICARYTSCSDACPFFREAGEEGIHACGTLCEILYLKNPEKAKQIAEMSE